MASSIDSNRAYDSNALRDELKERGATAVIHRVDEIDYDREITNLVVGISFVTSSSSVVLRCVLRRRM